MLDTIRATSVMSICYNLLVDLIPAIPKRSFGHVYNAHCAPH